MYSHKLTSHDHKHVDALRKVLLIITFGKGSQIFEVPLQLSLRKGNVCCTISFSRVISQSNSIIDHLSLPGGLSAWCVVQRYQDCLESKPTSVKVHVSTLKVL